MLHENELFREKALRIHTKQKIQGKSSVGNTSPEKKYPESKQAKKETFFLPCYGRLGCAMLPEHLSIHHVRSVPSISYMWVGFLKAQVLGGSILLVHATSVPIFLKSMASQVRTIISKTQKLKSMNASFNLKFICV